MSDDALLCGCGFSVLQPNRYTSFRREKSAGQEPLQDATLELGSTGRCSCTSS
jgi:hypothetical protein